MTAPAYIPLRELAEEQARFSQIICYNSRDQPVLLKHTAMLKHDNIDFTHLPAPGVQVAPESMLFGAVAKDSVTVDGHSIVDSKTVVFVK